MDRWRTYDEAPITLHVHSRAQVFDCQFGVRATLCSSGEYRLLPYPFSLSTFSETCGLVSSARHSLSAEFAITIDYDNARPPSCHHAVVAVVLTFACRRMA